MPGSPRWRRLRRRVDRGWRGDDKKLGCWRVTAAKVAADVATQAELDAVAAAKADVGHNHSGTYAPLIPDWIAGRAYVVGELAVSSGTL